MEQGRAGFTDAALGQGHRSERGQQQHNQATD
jgi:hypothetical protein